MLEEATAAADTREERESAGRARRRAREGEGKIMFPSGERV
jgi:hypothetical protein